MEGGDEEVFYKVHRGAITGLAVMPNGDVKSVGWDDAFRTSFREKQHNMSTSFLGFLFNFHNTVIIRYREFWVNQKESPTKELLLLILVLIFSYFLPMYS
jgi:hypothetical protein